MSAGIDFEHARFSPATHVRYPTHRYVETALASVPGIRSVLEIGCGPATGLIELATRHPNVAFSGVDVSAAAIAEARARTTRVRIFAGDFVTLDTGIHDVLCSESTLQLIGSEDAPLARKLAHDVRSGGIVVCTMPYDCWWNRALMALRTVLKAVRSPLLDRSILALGSRLYPDFTSEALADRLAYLYTPVRRFDGRRFRRVMHDAGLDVETWQRLPSTSIAKPKHALIVFRKGSPP